MKKFNAVIQTGRYYLNDPSKVTTYIHMSVTEDDKRLGYLNINLPEETYQYYKDAFKPENGVAEPVKEVINAYLKRIWLEDSKSKDERLQFQKLINDNINELEQNRLKEAIESEEKHLEQIKDKIARYRKTLDYFIKDRPAPPPPGSGSPGPGPSRGPRR